MFNSSLHSVPHPSLNKEYSVPHPSIATSSSSNSHGSLPFWTTEEQEILNEGVVKYAYGENLIEYYSRIANDLPYKSASDVAWRIRFMEELARGSVNLQLPTYEEERQNRERNHNLIRESQEQGDLDAMHFLPHENVPDPAVMPSFCVAQPNVAQPNVAPYASATMTMDNGNVISPQCPIDEHELLEQNTKILSKISANIDSLQLPQNIPLVCEVRDNIMNLLNGGSLKIFPDVMNRVPPFNFGIDEAKLNSILQQAKFPPQ